MRPLLLDGEHLCGAKHGFPEPHRFDDCVGWDAAAWRYFLELRRLRKLREAEDTIAGHPPVRDEEWYKQEYKDYLELFLWFERTPAGKKWKAERSKHMAMEAQGSAKVGTRQQSQTPQSWSSTNEFFCKVATPCATKYAQRKQANKRHLALWPAGASRAARLPRVPEIRRAGLSRMAELARMDCSLRRSGPLQQQCSTEIDN